MESLGSKFHRIAEAKNAERCAYETKMVYDKVVAAAEKEARDGKYTGRFSLERFPAVVTDRGTEVIKLLAQQDIFCEFEDTVYSGGYDGDTPACLDFNFSTNGRAEAQKLVLKSNRKRTAGGNNDGQNQ